ncbi:hypothetical protein M5K25_004882 [Dendrobium thyrsiflorum]|uniref:Uncharacterized protein n=1 Tax=Dendrobium thyrsiflorum TaxID=117978 RepID=A0ABD0VG16_DENTH
MCNPPLMVGERRLCSAQRQWSFHSGRASPSPAAAVLGLFHGIKNRAGCCGDGWLARSFVCKVAAALAADDMPPLLISRIWRFLLGKEKMCLRKWPVVYQLVL